MVIRHAGWEVVADLSTGEFSDQWVDPQNQLVAFGRLPLEDGEVLPAGALEEEDPDE